MNLEINPELRKLWALIDERGEVPCSNWPDAFHADKDDSYAQMSAKKLCQDCPIIKECGAYALRHEQLGVWGGMSAKERISIRGRLPNRQVA